MVQDDLGKGTVSDGRLIRVRDIRIEGFERRTMLRMVAVDGRGILDASCCCVSGKPTLQGQGGLQTYQVLDPLENVEVAEHVWEVCNRRYEGSLSRSI
jgi:hypothetical protein